MSQTDIIDHGDAGCSGGRVRDLPEELLVQIFANLELQDINKLSLVSRRWYQVVTDSHIWMTALKQLVGSQHLPYQLLFDTSNAQISAQSKDVTTTTTTSSSNSNSQRVRQLRAVAKQKITRGWRSEYIERARLLKRWGLGRRVNRLEFNPRLGNVHRVLVDWENGWLLAVSLTHGVAVRCNHLNGSVYVRGNDTKGLMYATGPRLSEVDGELADVHQLAESLVRARMDRRVQTVDLSRSHVAWGGRRGLVSVTHLHANGSKAQHIMMDQADWHSGVITAVKLCAKRREVGLGKFSHPEPARPQQKQQRNVASGKDVVVSAGTDWTVRLWDAQSGRLLCVLEAPQAVVSHVALLEHRWVVGSTKAGSVLVWDLDLIFPENQGECRAEVAPLPSVEASEEAVSLRETRDGELQPKSREADNPWLEYAAAAASEAQSANFRARPATRPTRVINLPDVASRPRPITHMITDIDASSGETFVIIAAGPPYGSGSSPNGLWKYSIPDGKLLQTYTLPGSESFAKLTALEYLPTRQGLPGGPVSGYMQSSLLTAGDVLGRVVLWPAPSVRSSSSSSEHPDLISHRTDIVRPLWIVDDAHKSPISSLHIDALKIVTGSQDGYVKLWEPTSGSLIRTIRCRGGGRGAHRHRHEQPVAAMPAPEPQAGPNDEPRNGRDSIGASFTSGREINRMINTLWETNQRMHGGNPHLHHQQQQQGLPEDMPGRLNPWFWSIHPSVITHYSRADLLTAQGLVGRSPEGWAAQLRLTQRRFAQAATNPTPHWAAQAIRGADIGGELDEEISTRHPFYGSLIYDVSSSYTGLVVANGTRIQALALHGVSIPGAPQSAEGYSARSRKGRPIINSYSWRKQLEREVDHELAQHRQQAERERQRRIEDYLQREYLRREHVDPLEELDLSEGEMLQYAQLLSMQEQEASLMLPEGAVASAGPRGGIGAAACGTKAGAEEEGQAKGEIPPKPEELSYLTDSEWATIVREQGFLTEPDVVDVVSGPKPPSQTPSTSSGSSITTATSKSSVPGTLSLGAHAKKDEPHNFILADHVISGMTEEEMLRYALQMSKSAENS